MTSLDYAAAARVVREAVRDKAYRAYPLGGEWAAFMRWGRGSWTPATYRDYESCGDKLARTYPDLELSDFEPPVGIDRLEEFMDLLWGERAPGTYNKNLTIVQQFFGWAVSKGKLHGDPSRQLRRRKKRQPHREVYSEDAVKRIITNGPSDDLRYLYRDRVLLRLLHEWALRKGALRAIQYKHFDRDRRRLTIFTKGEKVFDKIILDDAFWSELEKAQMALGAQPDHYLLGSRHTFNRFAGYDPVTGKAKTQRIERDRLEKPLSSTATHHWYYRCLERAGIVATGQRSGERMHKARHTSGQLLLEEFRDIKLVQKHLNHTSMTTTANTYVDYDEFQVGDRVEEMLQRRRGE